MAAKNWKDDCNECFCVENGVPACTLKGCYHGPELVQIEVEPKKEESNKFFVSQKLFAQLFS